MVVELDQAEVEARIVGLTDQQASAVVCALIGHSRVQDTCLGYFNCARCGAQVGDTLGGTYEGAKVAVIRDHHCDVCRANVGTLTWKDTYRLPAEAVAYLELLKDVEASKRIGEQQRAAYEATMASLRERARA